MGRVNKGHQWKQERIGEPAVLVENLAVGDSFGEEVILRLEELYKYTIVATDNTTLVHIREAKFSNIFSRRPEVIDKLRNNFFKNKCGPSRAAGKGKQVRSYLREDAVLEAVEDI